MDDVLAHGQPEPGAANGNSSIVWKFISGILAAILVAGAPGYLYLYLNTPTNDEFNRVNTRQQLVLQRLAVLETQHHVFLNEQSHQRLTIEHLRDALDRRANGSGR